MTAIEAEIPLYKAENESNTFALANQDAWVDYKEFRPAYPQSMLELWYDYHRRHGGKFDAVHDVGAGGGILSEILARSFNHVFVSDPGQTNLAAARAALRPTSQFTFHRATGEESWINPSSIDFVAMGVSFHWMDTEQALAAASASLKPGGTFAAVFYSAALHFPQHPRLDNLLQKAEIEAFRGFSNDSARFQSPEMMAALRRMQRGFNTLELPDEKTSGFQDWTRVNINLHNRSDVDAFNFVPEELFPIPPSQVKPSEKVIDLEDKSWSREVDIGYVKRFLLSITLPYDERCWEHPSWVEFERIINNEFGGKVMAEWPVAIILGSKK